MCARTDSDAMLTNIKCQLPSVFTEAISLSQVALQRCNVNFFARFLGWILEGEFWEVNFSTVNFSGASFPGKNRTKKFDPRIRVRNSGVQNSFSRIRVQIRVSEVQNPLCRNLSLNKSRSSSSFSLHRLYRHKTPLRQHPPFGVPDGSSSLLCPASCYIVKVWTGQDLAAFAGKNSCNPHAGHGCLHFWLDICAQFELGVVWRRGEVGKGWDCNTWPRRLHSKHVWNIPSHNLLQTSYCTRSSRNNAIVLQPLRATTSHELLHELLRQQTTIAATPLAESTPSPNSQLKGLPRDFGPGRPTGSLDGYPYRNTPGYCQILVARPLLRAFSKAPSKNPSSI